MKKIFSLLSLITLTSCWTTSWDSQDCPTIDVKVADPRFSVTGHYDGPVFDPCKDDKILGCEGLPYQERTPYLADDACFGPEKGESYCNYLDRASETMRRMEEEIAKLEETLTEKKESTKHLNEQLSSLQKANHDLMVALSNEKEKGASTPPPTFAVYEVQKGDTLQSISYQAYNTHKGWVSIYRFNLERLPNGPNQIEVGQQLLIPLPI